MIEVSPDDLKVGYHYLFYESDLNEPSYKYISIFELRSEYDGDTSLAVIERYIIWNDSVRYCVEYKCHGKERSLFISNGRSMVKGLFKLSSEEYYTQVIMREL